VIGVLPSGHKGRKAQLGGALHWRRCFRLGRVAIVPVFENRLGSVIDGLSQPVGDGNGLRNVARPDRKREA
jgi:hypothetical protein